jgi:hypothetical protein
MGYDDVIAETAMALCQNALCGKQCPCVEVGAFRCADAHPGEQARAAAPILMEYGRALERAAVVEWLRGHECALAEVEPFDEAADIIEAGQHLSDNAEAIARGE